MAVIIDLKPELTVLSRIRVLHHVVHELSEGFGLTSDSLEIIAKGVLQRQLLSGILIHYLNEHGRIVGKVTMTIDWDKHIVRASSENGSTFDIARGRSIAEQVSEMYAILVQHTREFRRALGVKRIETHYTIRRDITADRGGPAF